MNSASTSRTATSTCFITSMKTFMFCVWIVRKIPLMIRTINASHVTGAIRRARRDRFRICSSVFKLSIRPAETIAQIKPSMVPMAWMIAVVSIFGTYFKYLIRSCQRNVSLLSDYYQSPIKQLQLSASILGIKQYRKEVINEK